MSVELKQCSPWNTEPKCSCGAPRKAWRLYCSECARQHRKGFGSLTTEAQRRANARSYLNVYVKRGKIEKKPCASCGAKDVEAHHDDYSRPLDVIWLCRPCHERLHGVKVTGTRVCRSRADSGKPPALYEFYNLLRNRGMSTGKLAEQIGYSRAAVTRVLIGLRKPGQILPKVEALLHPEEIAALHNAQRTEWAGARIAKRPRWNSKRASA